METQDATPLPSPRFDPLAGWEAATQWAQWNLVACEWMTQRWQQWWSLVTAPFGIVAPAALVDPLAFSVTPAPAGAQGVEETRAARASSPAPDSRLRGNDDKPRAASTARPKRSARPKKAGAKSRARS